MTRRPMPPTQSGLFPGLFSGFLGCLLAGSACAADLPRRAAPPPPPLPPAFTWTGFYVGANAGYGFRGGSSRYSDATYGTVTESGGKGGFVGGGQIGYNYQITPGSGWVLGAEADLQATGFGRRGDGTVGGGGGGGGGARPPAEAGEVRGCGAVRGGTERGSRLDPAPAPQATRERSAR